MRRIGAQAAGLVVLMAICLGFALILAGCASSDMDAQIAKADQPNIVIIMADDMGYSDIASDTPNLQAMEARGMRFTDFHTAPFCTPTRADVQTGRYHQLMGLNNALAWDSTKGLSPAEITVAEHLRDYGYNTALVGKWHLGRQNEFWPNNHGYNYFFGMTAGAADYFSHEDAGGQIDWWENFTHLKTREYSTSAFTREAIKFLNRTTQPFLLVLAYQAVHAPYQAPDGTTGYRKTLVAMDESIGQVTAALPSSTYVFFLSDNGGAKPSHNAPLRGNKGSVYEGGHRVTALASGPGVPGGAHRDALLAAIDLFPTILALTGIPAPLGVQLDGRDFSPVLLGTGTLPARQLFFTQGSDWAVRDNKKWKLLYDGSSNKLFDMTTDIGEEHNMAGSHPDIVSALTADFNAWTAHLTADSGIIDFANGVPLCFPDEGFGEGLPG